MSFCSGCTACCRSEKIPIQDFEDHSKWETTIENGHRYLKRVKGECVYLTENGCSTYENQPFVCKSFNCVSYFRSLTRQQRKGREKIFPSAKAIFAAARERMAS